MSRRLQEVPTPEVSVYDQLGQKFDVGKNKKSEHDSSADETGLFRYLRNLFAIAPPAVVAASYAIAVSEHVRQNGDMLAQDGAVLTLGALVATGFEVGRRVSQRNARRTARQVIELCQQPPEMPIPGWATEEVSPNSRAKYYLL